MCLSVAVCRPDDVLAKGEHAGFEWNVVHNGSGFRCGYVRVPNGHPWHGKDYHDDDFSVEVHGGCTFGEPDLPCDKGGADDAWWIGFDCMHAWDAPDPELPNARVRDKWIGADCIVRSQEYVEAECRSLCEQASKAAAAPTPTEPTQ